MSVRIGEVQTFRDVVPDKAQALKVLEEAAEVYGAWQAWDPRRGPLSAGSPSDGRHRALVSERRLRTGLLGEIADVIQAACNLAEALGVVDLSPYMEACRERNEARGRM